MNSERRYCGCVASEGPFDSIRITEVCPAHAELERARIEREQIARKLMPKNPGKQRKVAGNPWGFAYNRFALCPNNRKHILALNARLSCLS